MDFDFQQYFTKLWMHELRQILLIPYQGRRFPPGTPASSATKTDHHDMAYRKYC